ncbi:MAG: Gfo/Idh/MocA family oxidoreductase [Gemmatimonadota bacterium]
MTPSDRRSFLAQTAGALAGISILPELVGAEPFRISAPVTVGIIGVGRQGRAIITELQKLPDVTIAAVCDTSPTRLTLAGERAAGAATLADYRQLLARPDISAVILATPTHLHRDIAQAAIAAGRHLYIESPLAHTTEDCQAIARSAAGVPTVVQVGFQGRSNPVYQRAKPLFRSELRETVSLSAQYHRKTSWRFPAPDPGTAQATNWRLDPAVSTGLAGEIGAQQFDVAAWYREELPIRVAGRGAIRLHHDGREIADTIAVDLTWADGVALHYAATLANSYGGQFETFHGINGALKLAWSHGWLFKEVDAPSQGWEVYATRQQFFQDEGIILVADATKLSAQGKLKEGIGLPHPSLYYALADFVRSVAEGTPVACTAADGARSSIVGILANQAVVTGRPVEISS